MKKINYWCLFLLFFIFFGCITDKENNYLEAKSYKIIGESLVFNNTEGNCLIKNNISNLTLYSIDSKRNRIYYKENIDYVVTKNRIKRTINSSIPNFAGHNVVTNLEGTFTFGYSPRNPSLTIPFHVYADYNFEDVETVYGEFNKNFLSPSLKEKLNNKEDIKIGSIGTSITSGAHTLEKFYFDSDKQSYIYLLANAINKIYKNDVSVKNYSQGGSSVSDAFNLLPTMLEDKNDIIVIEFGMNDHIGSNWSANISSFEDKLGTLIDKFQQSGTNVIIVGFFQQNQNWDLEFEGSTFIFNQVLSNLAKKYNCYFADINGEFSKYSQKKINEDLCGDFMHHPTSFGHLLYYKTLIPVFLSENKSDGFVYDLLK